MSLVLIQVSQPLLTILAADIISRCQSTIWSGHGHGLRNRIRKKQTNISVDAILLTSAWSGPVYTGTQYLHVYSLAFRVPALFCAYQHFWHVVGTQSKIVRVWVIRLYDPIYDYKLYKLCKAHYPGRITSHLDPSCEWTQAESVYFLVWCQERRVEL